MPVKEVRFTEIKYKRSYDIIPDIIKEKVKLKYGEIILIIDLLLFFLKRKFLQEEKIFIKSFGTLYVKDFRRAGKLIRFRNSVVLKHIVNRRRENEFNPTRYSYTEEFDQIFRNIAKILLIKPKDISFIFSLFLYGISRALLEKEVIKIRNFGIFYCRRRNYRGNYEEGIIGQVDNFVWVKFRPTPRFVRELYKREDEIYCFKRVKNLLKLHGIENKLR